MDYVPNKRDARYRWYKNMSTNVVAEAVKFGAPAGDATAIKGVVDGIIAKMDASDAAKDATDTARLLEHNAEAPGLTQVRAKVRNWKTLPGWAASGSEGVLELSGSATNFDPTNYQTTLKAKLVPDGVRLEFTKKGVEGVNIYQRLSATANWHKTGMCLHSPFIDTTPLAQPGVPERREYMARGVINDVEIGHDSDSIYVNFAG